MAGMTLEQLQSMGAKPVAPAAPTTPAPSAVVPKGPGVKLADLQKAGATPVAGPVMPTSNLGVSRETAPEEPGFMQSMLQGMAKPFLKINSSLGRTFTGLNSMIHQTTGNKELSDKEWQDSQRINDQGMDYGYFGKVKPLGSTGTAKDLLEAAGTGAEIASYIVPGSEGAGVIKAGLTQGIKRGVIQGAKVGAKAGALGGFGSSLQDENPGVVNTVVKTGVGGLTGGLLGGVTGGAVGAIGSKAAGAARTAEQAALLEKNVPDAKIATKVLDNTGKVVNDAKGAEAVRQGIPEADVALIKSASPADKAKMADMLNIREGSLSNKRSIARSTDVVGDTFLDQAKFLAEKNRQAGKDLNMVASRLEGKKVDPTPSLTRFGSDLENAGISIKGKSLNFKGSDFEGIGPSQTALKNVFERAMRFAKSGDALEGHRLKSFIDEVVDYGKSAEGLSGRAQRILKGLRHEVDQTLDKKFPQYNKVNTVFADTIGELNKVSDAMGHSFKIGDTFANAKAGTALRRVMSNTQSRAGMLQMIDSMQKVGQKYGYKGQHDVVTQALFADTLEKMLGTEAPTSFLGNLEKGIDHVGEIGDVAGGFEKGIVPGIVKAGKYVINATRGVNQESKINALRELLQSGAKPTSVFGKK